MDIRSETGDDLEAIRAVHLAAFPTSAEADLVERIRASEGFVPELSLVAVPTDGPMSAVGHILLSHVGLAGSTELILALAPMAVLPEHQRRGVGSALVRAALDTAEALEEAVVVVLGHPWFYPRFGFQPASRYGIFPTDPWPDAAFMAKPLTRWSRDLRGRVVYPSSFDGL
jgi:putative acetyltransferase